MSRRFIKDLLGEAHPAQQVLESRILTEGIESRILFEETDERPRGAEFNGSLQ